jgi:AcrR family transcriptional regulator
MKKRLNSRIKANVSESIFQSISKFNAKNKPEDLTITDISKLSGYSIGNIYHHFKNIDSIFKSMILSHLRKRIDLQIEMMSKIKPDLEAAYIIQFLLESLIHSLFKNYKRTAILYLLKRFLNDIVFINEINKIQLKTTDAILKIIKENKTNTFKKLKREEIEMNIILTSAIVLRPVLFGHKLALTEYHKKQIINTVSSLYIKT